MFLFVFKGSFHFHKQDEVTNGNLSHTQQRSLQDSTKVGVWTLAGPLAYNFAEIQNANVWNGEYFWSGNAQQATFVDRYILLSGNYWLYGLV